MNEEFKNSLFWNIIKFGITLIASWLVVVVIFAMCTEDELVPKYNKQMLQLEQIEQLITPYLI